MSFRGITIIKGRYDYMGRRDMKKVSVNGTITLHQKYIYRDYLQIACVDLSRSAHPCLWLITWDPTETTATRPLAIQKDGTWYCYGHDLTKNVCEVFGSAGNIRTVYSYTPYGEVTAEGNVSQPVQWSSEFKDEELGLVYYNFRHYNPADGRWINRDPLQEEGGWNLYVFVGNNSIDALGLICNNKCSPGACLYNDYEIEYKNELDNNNLNPDDINDIELAVKIINYLSDFNGVVKYKIPTPIRIVNKSRMDNDAIIKKEKELLEKRLNQGFVVVKVKVSVKKCVCQNCLIIGRRMDWDIIESEWETYGEGKKWKHSDAQKKAGPIIAKMMKKICRDQTNSVK